MNEFLLDLRFFHPSLVSSLKLPPLSRSLAVFPSLSVRIPLYLSEQGKSERCGAEEIQKRREEERKKRKKRVDRERQKESRRNKSSIFVTTKGRGLIETIREQTESERRVLPVSRPQISLFFLPPVPCWAVFHPCERPVAILVRQCWSGVGWMPSCCKKNWWNGCCAHEWERPGRR